MKQPDGRLRRTRSQVVVFQIGMAINCILVLANLACVVLVAGLYVNRLGRMLVFSIDQLVAFHFALGCAISFAVLAVVLGCVILRALRRQQEVQLSFCIVASFVLMVLRIGVLYAILNEWRENMLTGIVFAVQSYEPKGTCDLTDAMEGIQACLGCCGRIGPSDYGIANGAFAPGFVPVSCCDLEKFGATRCYNYPKSEYEAALSNLTRPRRRDVKAASGETVPISMATARGCWEPLHQFVHKWLWATFVSLAALDLLSMLASGFFLKTSHLLVDIEEGDENEEEEQDSTHRLHESPISSTHVEHRHPVDNGNVRQRL